MASAEAPSKVPDSQAAQLQDLNARAARHYSLKEYTAASDLYAQASELQASLNGETSTKNADLLYLYGRSLYQVGVSKSDVLGGKTAGEAETEKPKKSKQTRATVETESGASQPATAEQRVAEEVVAKVVQDKDGSSKSQDEGAANKPYFQITGDENWDDSDEDEDSAEDAGEDGMGGAGEGEEEEAEDDLTAAWNVLDLARVLFDRKLTELEDASGKAKANGDAPDVRHIKERLADTHDLLAEISLEGEKFPAAVTDFGAALSMKHDLYPIESSLIAEAHYKLSLALEFASTTRAAGEDGEPDSTTDAQVDEAGREEAAKEMEAAIQSCKLRVKHEEALLAAGSEAEAEDEAKITRASIDDVKEMIADMKQRATDLRNPPVNIEAATTGPAGVPDGSNPLSGILGSLLGESPAEQQTRLEEAKKGATDLTGLVRRKKPAEAATAAETSVNGGGKRKVEFAEEVEEVGTAKKTRVEDE